MNNNINSEIEPLLKLLSTKKNKILPIVLEILNLEESNNLEIQVEQLINSYLHMMCNRLFKSNQRLHELVLYDLLSIYYKAKEARNKINIDIINYPI